MTFLTLITILSIETLNAWQSLFPDTWQLRVIQDGIRNSCDVLSIRATTTKTPMQWHYCIVMQWHHCIVAFLPILICSSGKLKVNCKLSLLKFNFSSTKCVLLCTSFSAYRSCCRRQNDFRDCMIWLFLVANLDFQF